MASTAIAPATRRARLAVIALVAASFGVGCGGGDKLVYDGRTVNGADAAVAQAVDALEPYAAETGIDVADAKCYLRLDGDGVATAVQCLPVTFPTDETFDAVSYPASVGQDPDTEADLVVTVNTDQPPTPIAFDAGDDRFVPALPAEFGDAGSTPSSTS